MTLDVWFDGMCVRDYAALSTQEFRHSGFSIRDTFELFEPMLDGSLPQLTAASSQCARGAALARGAVPTSGCAFRYGRDAPMAHIRDRQDVFEQHRQLQTWNVRAARQQPNRYGATSLVTRLMVRVAALVVVPVSMTSQLKW